MQEQLLKEQLTSNRRLLQLLGEKRTALQRRVELLREMHNPGVGQEPFFYSAVDADDEPGIEISQQTGTAGVANVLGSDNKMMFRGVVKIQDDAPFIWTHVGVTMRFLYDTSPATNTLQEQEDADLASVFKGASELDSELNNTLEIGFIDVTSGRSLWQSRTASDDAIFDGEGGLFPVSLFDLNPTNSPAAPAGAAYVPGHGPTGLYQLPAEVEIPTSSAVEVLIRSTRVPGAGYNGFTNPRFRAYVTLGGYKIRA